MLQLLAPLAVAILISGLDDLTIDLTWLVPVAASKTASARPDLFPPGRGNLIQRRGGASRSWFRCGMSIEVIARMIEHNIAADPLSRLSHLRRRVS